VRKNTIQSTTERPTAVDPSSTKLFSTTTSVVVPTGLGDNSVFSFILFSQTLSLIVIRILGGSSEALSPKSGHILPLLILHSNNTWKTCSLEVFHEFGP